MEIQNFNYFFSEYISSNNEYTSLRSNLSHKKQINKDERLYKVKLLIIKVTDRCNMHCSYCHEHVETKHDMSLGRFRHIIDSVLSSTTEKKVKIIFHGGEPLLRPNNWYEDAISYCNGVAKNRDVQIQFSMQSNALGLDISKINTLKRLKIKLGISLDGPANLTNPLRPNGKLAILNFLKAKAEGLEPKLLVTINHMNFSNFKIICEWIDSKLGVAHFKANPVASVGRGANLPEMAPHDIFKAYHSIIEYMIDKKGKSIVEDNIRKELFQLFLSSDDMTCRYEDNCYSIKCGAGTSILAISPIGDLYPCGRFPHNTKEYYLGKLRNIVCRRDLEICCSNLIRLNSEVNKQFKNCYLCEARKICSFGCNAFILRSKTSFNLDCIPTKMRYAYYIKNRMRLIPIIDTIFKNDICSIDSINCTNHYDYGNYIDYCDYRDY